MKDKAEKIKKLVKKGKKSLGIMEKEDVKHDKKMPKKSKKC